MGEWLGRSRPLATGDPNAAQGDLVQCDPKSIGVRIVLRDAAAVDRSGVVRIAADYPG